MSKNNMKKYIKIILLVLIAATLVFIFAQSMKPRSQSAEESNKVGEIIAEIIPPDTPVGDYVQKNIRKLAHYSEFFILGLEVAVFVLLYIKKLRHAVLALPAAALVALLDETIQIFSGRGPSIVDVWIDVFGFVSSYVIIYTVYSLIVFIYKKCKQ